MSGAATSGTSAHFNLVENAFLGWSHYVDGERESKIAVRAERRTIQLNCRWNPSVYTVQVRRRQRVVSEDRSVAPEKASPDGGTPQVGWRNLLREREVDLQVQGLMSCGRA